MKNSKVFLITFLIFQIIFILNTETVRASDGYKSRTQKCQLVKLEKISKKELRKLKKELKKELKAKLQPQEKQDCGSDILGALIYYAITN